MDLARRAFTLGFLIAPLSHVALGQEDGLLPAHRAFVIGARRVGPDMISVDLQVAPGYIVYRDRFAFSADTPVIKLVDPQFPAAVEKFDRVLEKRVLYYEGAISVLLRVRGPSQPFRLKVQVQGCAVEAGVCYPPYLKEFGVPSLRG